MKQFLEKFGFWGLVLIVIFSGSMLIFDDFTSNVGGFLKTDVQQVDKSGRVLRIAYLFAPNNLNPYSTDLSNRSRLIDVYEPLVNVDRNLSPIPALARTYGRVSELEWRFKLRKNVFFHDGSDFGMNDVLKSFEAARESISFKVFFDDIDLIEPLDDETLKILTKTPDPLFLNKISKLLIASEQSPAGEKYSGTGPYKLMDDSDLSKVVYLRNDDYWGDKAFFERAEIWAINSKNERVNALLDRTIDFLVNVPPDSVAELKDNEVEVMTMPSLEVGFVMFNFQDKIFKEKSFRSAVAKSLNKDTFLDLAFGYAKTINQFVSNGVFGYNPDLKGIAYDKAMAEKDLRINASAFEKIKVEFYYPENLKLLGQYFKEQLGQIGFDTELIALSDEELQNKMLRAELGFYYLGWRHDSGDAINFLSQILHSKTGIYGELNGMNYKNAFVDQLIEKSIVNFNMEERLNDMQEVMRIVVEEDVVGVPLFETESIFAFQNNLIFQPRVDSQVYLSKITE